MIDIKIPKVKLDAQAFLKSLDLQNTLRSELQNVRTRIVKDTVSGKQATGAGLKPYSASYSEYKKKKTGSSTPNLTLTGELMRSIVDSEIKDGHQLAFQGQHKGNFANSQLAQWLYEKKFTGWFQYSKQKDIEPIWTRLKQKFGNNIKNIIDIKLG